MTARKHAAENKDYALSRERAAKFFADELKEEPVGTGFTRDDRPLSIYSQIMTTARFYLIRYEEENRALRQALAEMVEATGTITRQAQRFTMDDNKTIDVEVETPYHNLLRIKAGQDDRYLTRKRAHEFKQNTAARVLQYIQTHHAASGIVPSRSVIANELDLDRRTTDEALRWLEIRNKIQFNRCREFNAALATSDYRLLDVSNKPEPFLTGMIAIIPTRRGSEYGKRKFRRQWSKKDKTQVNKPE